MDRTKLKLDVEELGQDRTRLKLNVDGLRQGKSFFRV